MQLTARATRHSFLYTNVDTSLWEKVKQARHCSLYRDIAEVMEQILRNNPEFV